MKTAIYYSIFAAIASAVNLLVQFITFLIYNDQWSLFLALCTGTFAGLLVKFILDRNFIFDYKPEKNADNFFALIRYSLTGILTTAIFWGMEILFARTFGGNMLYLGGAIGLTIGYAIKYHLDKNYVFKHSIKP